MENISATLAPMAERDAEIRRLLEAGWSHQDVADRYGVERQRIQQIATRLEIGPLTVALIETPGGYTIVGRKGTDEEAVRKRIESALRTAKIEMRHRG